MNAKIVLVLILGLLLRISFFSVSPPSLNWDEASLGYNAYSILKTGHDEWSRFLPISFESFGDYKLPVYVYTDVVFQAIFGLNEFAIRLPSLLAGILSIYLIYLIVFRMTKSENIALWSGFLFCINPSMVFLSRIALEANLSLCLVLLGIYALMRGLESARFLYLAAISFSLSIFCYNSARIFVPLFIISFFLLNFKNLKVTKLNLLLVGLILLVSFSIATYFALFQDSSARYYWVAILDQGAINFLNEHRGASTLPSLVTNIIYNRFSYFSFEVVKNMLLQLSPVYLFFSGGSNHQFSNPGFGIMNIGEILTVPIGLLITIRKRINWIYFCWLIIAAIPAAITREAPHVLRSIYMVPTFVIFSAVGLDYICRNLKKLKIKHIVIVPIFLLLINFGIYFYSYIYVYPINNSQSFQYGYKQVVEFINTHSDRQFIMTKKYGEPHIFYLVYSKYDPFKYQFNPTLERNSYTNWRWVDNLDNIRFVNDWEIKSASNTYQNVYLITTENNTAKGEKIEQIKFLDGSVAFEIYKI